MNWYHGTRAGFQRGGLLVPPVHHGKQANVLPDYPDAVNWVFITPDRDIAEHFARTAKTGRGRPRVLTVQPLEPVHTDHATWCGEDGYLYRTGSARVTAVELLDP